MIKKIPEIIPEIIDPSDTYSLEQFCSVCRIAPKLVIEMVEEGVVEPGGVSRAEWTFNYRAVMRIQRAYRLQQDLELNLPGVALSVDLLEEIERLRLELKRLQFHLKSLKEPLIKT